MEEYVEIKKSDIIFAGSTIEEKKANELIYDLSSENENLCEENQQLKKQIEDLKQFLKNYTKVSKILNEIRVCNEILQKLEELNKDEY